MVVMFSAIEKTKSRMIVMVIMVMTMMVVAMITMTMMVAVVITMTMMGVVLPAQPL